MAPNMNDGKSTITSSDPKLGKFKTVKVARFMSGHECYEVDVLNMQIKIITMQWYLNTQSSLNDRYLRICCLW